jgi:hypothetical protein
MRLHILLANRFISRNLRNILAQKRGPFRDRIEPISHILQAAVQREIHRRVCMAAKNGEQELLSSLLRFSVELDRSDMFGTPLHHDYAAVFARQGSIRLLLDKGSDGSPTPAVEPGALNPHNEIPLHLAAMRETLCAELLLQ